MSSQIENKTSPIFRCPFPRYRPIPSKLLEPLHLVTMNEGYHREAYPAASGGRINLPLESGHCCLNYEPQIERQTDAVLRLTSPFLPKHKAYRVLLTEAARPIEKGV